MAFEQRIEADQVEDLSLFSSFLRAPVVGTILWLLGGEDAKKAEEEERRGSESNETEGDYRDGELNDGGKRTKNALEPWPQISSGVDSDSDDQNFPSYEKFVTSELSTPEPSKHLLRSDSGPASRVVDELVAVMDAASLDEQRAMKKSSPRRSSSKSNLASLEDEADANSSERQPSADTKKPSSRNQSHTSVSKKKMSWSDEAGRQPLVEYFDDRIRSSRPQRSRWRPSRSCSFDSQDASSRSSRGRSQVRVIKSALKRSGSYSPPMQMYAGPSYSDSVCSTSSYHSSNSGMKSFKSLSVVGSTDSDSVDCISPDENRHVGSVIPTGGAFPSFQLTLGTAVVRKPEGVSSQDEGESKTLTPKTEGPPIVGTSPVLPHSHHSNRQSSKPHHFLPHHSNGYVSPQYGFYVNITPPTPEMFYPRPPPGTFSDQSKNKAAQVQQPSHQQFAKQKKPFRPSPIPEVTTVVSPHENVKPPLQPMFHDSPHNTPGAVRKSLKPAFVKKNRMGMFLSDNPHQVFPTVPFG